MFVIHELNGNIPYKCELQKYACQRIKLPKVIDNKKLKEQPQQIVRLSEEL